MGTHNNKTTPTWSKSDFSFISPTLLYILVCISTIILEYKLLCALNWDKVILYSTIKVYCASLLKTKKNLWKQTIKKLLLLKCFTALHQCRT